jgi:hypothetical protein
VSNHQAATARIECRIPWDYSEAPEEGDETAVPNVPTPEGQMLGAELARLTDIEEERLRERFLKLHPRCDDCALRLGTGPNGCVSTLMDVVKCVAESVPFYCHKGARDGDAPKRLCAGFAVLAGFADDFSALAARSGETPT